MFFILLYYLMSDSKMIKSNVSIWVFIIIIIIKLIKCTVGMLTIILNIYIVNHLVH